MAVVVLPTPPFWFTTATIRIEQETGMGAGLSSGFEPGSLDPPQQFFYF
jgi:hypothetical protein